MQLTERQAAIVELRFLQRQHETNQDYLDDAEVIERQNRETISAMRRCGLDTGDDIDAIGWIKSGDGYRTCERLGIELSDAPLEAIAERVAKLETAIAEQANKGNGGRPPIKTEAEYLKQRTKNECEAIKLSVSMSASEIDDAMKKRGVVIQKDGVTTVWPHGNAKKIIDAYRKWRNRRDSATK